MGKMEDGKTMVECRSVNLWFYPTRNGFQFLTAVKEISTDPQDSQRKKKVAKKKEKTATTTLLSFLSNPLGAVHLHLIVLSLQLKD